jgi:FixJ family two-component response regulator
MGTGSRPQAMALVVSGLLNKQVAGELGISEIRVKAHWGQGARKMKAACFADLVTMAARQLGEARHEAEPFAGSLSRFQARR